MSLRRGAPTRLPAPCSTLTNEGWDTRKSEKLGFEEGECATTKGETRCKRGGIRRN